jgi:nitrate/TMAO reductase-like tetraheme cytochrome c subunit
MKKYKSTLKKFFFPPEGTPLWIRILPYAALGVLTLVVLVSSAYAWDYTNSPEFCGEACHTMPPEYTAYLTSPHARVDCVDCHIGEGFITTRITRKAGDAKHIISLAFKDYEFPITAKQMRPARETCELCHFPEKFSDDSLREIKHFGNDTYNTPSSTYLVMKTGGGSKRIGLGQGIHWHIENPVYYFASDHAEIDIPYVQVIGEDGSITEYIDIESDIDPDQIVPEDLQEMDCITCHNRITHLVNPPEEMLDQLLDRGVISTDIPDIRRQAIDLFYRPYETQDEALRSIAGLEGYYEHYYPDFYAENKDLVQAAIVALEDAYAQSVYPEQKSDWNSHPNHVGHIYSPGCFRCHDGKHLNEDQEAIRLECNVCHSIPVVAGESDFVANIEVSRGPEPESHLNSNWIAMHRDVFDYTCENCHTTEDPGGTSNISFCSNSACHGSSYEFAGFDAPGLREILTEQLPEPPPPEIEVIENELITYENTVGSLLVLRCVSCHGENAMVGLDFTSYETTMFGSDNGPVVLPAEPEGSSLILVQTRELPHFGQFHPEELDLVSQWIEAGAPEK